MTVRGVYSSHLLTFRNSHVPPGPHLSQEVLAALLSAEASAAASGTSDWCCALPPAAAADALATLVHAAEQQGSTGGACVAALAEQGCGATAALSLLQLDCDDRLREGLLRLYRASSVWAVDDRGVPIEPRGVVARAEHAALFSAGLRAGSALTAAVWAPARDCCVEGAPRPSGPVAELRLHEPAGALLVPVLNALRHSALAVRLTALKDFERMLMGASHAHIEYTQQGNRSVLGHQAGWADGFLGLALWQPGTEWERTREVRDTFLRPLDVASHA